MRKVNVRQMLSPRTYKPVANQFEIYHERRIKNDHSIIVYLGKTQLDEHYWDYSRNQNIVMNFRGNDQHKKRGDQSPTRENIYSQTKLMAIFSI